MKTLKKGVSCYDKNNCNQCRKFKFEMAIILNARRKVLAKGLIERIGLKDSISTVKFDGRSEQQILDIENHTQAVKILLDDLIRFDIIKAYDRDYRCWTSCCCRWRIFQRINSRWGDVLEKVEELSLLAPLHNPANAAGVRAFKELLPDITSVVVLILHSTQLCQRKLIATLYQQNITQKTRFVNMVPTVQVTSL